MKCPNCGNELKAEHLICEVCGEEIQMVPDFEPEIENSITETLSTLAAMQEGEDEKEKAVEEETEVSADAEEKETPEEAFGTGRKIWIAAVLVLIFVVAAISYGLYSYHIGTVDYQIEKAKEYAAEGNYTEALACLETAYGKEPSRAEILFLEADYYYIQEDREAARNVLLTIISAGVYSYEDVEEAYDKVITIYANEERYADINTLLYSCENADIVNRYQSYMAMEPEFSYVEGSYAEVIPLKLSSNTSGTIYYTTDGTVPTKNSQIYTAPIFLETGGYTISAFFVNDYGIESEVVTKNYTVTLSVPNAPEVALYSGEYNEPEMVAVEGTEGCTIYYTTDESEPDSDSVPYTGPIPMPLGKTTFKFVNISEEGLSSEITMRTYTLRLPGAIPTSQAVTKLVERLVENGYLDDAEGHNKRQTGTYSYQFSSVLRIDSYGDYFTIYEYYDDGTGLLNRTDKVFLVEIYTGEPAQLGYDDDGNFIAVPI